MGSLSLNLALSFDIEFEVVKHGKRLVKNTSKGKKKMTF